MARPSDDAKLRAVFAAHHQAIQRYCLRRLGPDRANDAAAEVFLVAWRRINDMPESSEALPWLYGVARNVVRHAHRTRQRQRSLISRVADLEPRREAGPADQVVRRDEDDRVVAALSLLREIDREVLRLRMWEDLSYAEIGTVLRMSPHAVGMRYRRALQRLGKALRDVEHGHALGGQWSAKGDTW